MSSSAPFEIRQLTSVSQAEEDALVQVIMEAFRNDPFVSASTGGELGNTPVFDAFTRCFVRGATVEGEIWAAEKDGGIVGSAIWFPPGTDFLGSEKQREVVKIHEYFALTKPGVAEWFMGYLHPGVDEFCGKALGGPKVRKGSQHLQILGVHSSHRGHGIGKALFEAGSQPALAKGHRVVWETATEYNLGLYKSWGAVEKAKTEWDSKFEGTKVPFWVLELEKKEE